MLAPTEHREDDASRSLRLQRLLPASERTTVAEALDGFGLWQSHETPSDRPKVLLNMVATADGRATIDGRSGALGGLADRALFHGLRSTVDGVLIGAGTVRVERYGRIVKDEHQRRLRLERGLESEPLACIVSGRMALDEDVPLLQEPAARVVMLTASAASLPPCPATVDYVRTPGGRLDLHTAIAELSKRFAVRTLLCEGGPHLARELLAEGLVDELFLSLSPLLAGGEPVGGEALRILAGAELDPPVQLELIGALSYDSCLFLRYGVSAHGRDRSGQGDQASV